MRGDVLPVTCVSQLRFYQKSCTFGRGGRDQRGDGQQSAAQARPGAQAGRVDSNGDLRVDGRHLCLVANPKREHFGAAVAQLLFYLANVGGASLKLRAAAPESRLSAPRVS